MVPFVWERRRSSSLRFSLDALRLFLQRFYKPIDDATYVILWYAAGGNNKPSQFFIDPTFTIDNLIEVTFFECCLAKERKYFSIYIGSERLHQIINQDVCASFLVCM